MPRSFDITADYPQSVERVHRAFTDEWYWRERLADSGASQAILDRMDTDPAIGVSVVTTQVIGSDLLPAVVTQFHRGDLRITRRENWTPVIDGRAEATVSGEVQGAPVTLGGNATLVPHGDGSRLTLHTSVEVRIPLVGGKIENFIRGQLSDLLAAEQAFTTQWLANNP